MVPRLIARQLDAMTSILMAKSSLTHLLKLLTPVDGIIFTESPIGQSFKIDSGLQTISLEVRITLVHCQTHHLVLV